MGRASKRKKEGQAGQKSPAAEAETRESTPESPAGDEQTSVDVELAAARKGGWSQWIILAVILLAGGLLRWSYLTELQHAPDFASPAADAAFHDYWARGLATGDWTPPEGEENPNLGSVPYLRPPAYPFFLAGAYKITGGSYLGARVVQMGLGLVNCVLAFLLGRSLFGRAAGLILAGFTACYWSIIYFEGELQAPVLIITISLLMALALRRWTIKPWFLWALVGGLLIGLLALVRANVLLFIPVAALWMLLVGRTRLSFGRALVHAALLVIGSAIAISPATIRNATVANDFVLISANGAINLYIGNNETSDGVSAKIPDLQEITGESGWSWFRYDQIVQGVSRLEGRNMKYSEVSRYFSGRAREYITGHFGDFIKLSIKRAVLFWGPAEISNNKALQFEKDNSATLRLIPSFPIAFSLSLLGLVILLLDMRSRRRGAERPLLSRPGVTAAALLIVLFILMYFVSFVPFLAAARFRVPLMPFIFLFGGYGLYRVGQFVVGGYGPQIAASIVGWFALFLLCGVSFVKYEPDLAWWHTDRADALARDNSLEAAVVEYRKALESNAGFVDAHIGLGTTLGALGRTNEAIAQFEEVVRYRPDRNDVVLRLGRLLAEQGKSLLEAKRYAEAERPLRRSIELNESQAASHVNLGIVLANTGRREDAIASYQKAIAINPKVPDAHYNLGNALRDSGQPEPAIAALTEAVRLNPEYVEAMINLANILGQQLRIDEAIGWYRKAIQYDAGNIIARCNLAGALYRQNRIDEAIAELETAKTFEPNNPAVLDRLNALLEFRRQGGGS